MVARGRAPLGFDDSFAYRSAADVFREHAALSAFENDGSARLRYRRHWRLSTTTATTRSSRCNGPRPPDGASRERLFARRRIFSRPTARPGSSRRSRRRPAPSTSEDFPFRLNTGRVRDQWHTMTRTGLSPRLAAHRAEPFVEVHPDDAARIGLRNDGFARVATRHGTGVLKVASKRASSAARCSSPIHWSEARPRRRARRRSGGAATDPYSGQPDAKATPAAIAPLEFRMRGFALDPRADRAARRHLVGADRGRQRRSATARDQRQSRRLARSSGRDLSRVSLPSTSTRPAASTGPRRSSTAGSTVASFVGPAEAAPPWDAVKALFEADAIAERERQTLLSGRNGLPDPGPVVCACFGVGLAHDSKHGRVRRNDGRRDRQGVARRHQLRLVSAGAAEACRPHEASGGRHERV